MKSDFLLAHLWPARALLEQGRFEAALAETAAAEQKAREWSVPVAARGFTCGKAGMSKDAEAVLQEMEALSKQRFVTAFGSRWSMPTGPDRRGVALAGPRLRRALALAGLAPPRSAVGEPAPRSSLRGVDLEDAVPNLGRRRGLAQRKRSRSELRLPPLKVCHGSHWTTSSARSSIDCGTVMPSALAVLRLITISNLVGCSTGRSAGVVPFKIRPA